MHDSIPETIEQLNRKLVGHYNYYGIRELDKPKEILQLCKMGAFQDKRRRDQSCWLTWAKFKEITRIHPLEWPKIRLTSAY